jgi:hypothetical protein
MFVYQGFSFKQSYVVQGTSDAEPSLFGENRFTGW